MRAFQPGSRIANILLLRNALGSSVMQQWYSRRDFVKNGSIALAGTRAGWFQGAASSELIDLKDCVLITSQNPTRREVKALTVLTEEVAKRSGLRWKTQGIASVTIYAGLAPGL